MLKETPPTKYCITFPSLCVSKCRRILCTSTIEIFIYFYFIFSRITLNFKIVFKYFFSEFFFCSCSWTFSQKDAELKYYVIARKIWSRLFWRDLWVFRNFRKLEIYFFFDWQQTHFVARDRKTIKVRTS